MPGILDATEWLYQPENYSGTGAWLDEANSHDAQFGSTSGADVNDPLFADFVSGQYGRFDGVANNNITTADYAELDITGDLTIRWRIALDTWEIDGASALIMLREDNTYRAEHAVVTDNIRLFWHDGTALRNLVSTASPVDEGLNNGQVYWFETQLDVDNGASDAALTVSWALDSADGEQVWNQLGGVVLFGSTTSIRTSAAGIQWGQVGGGSVPTGDFYNGQIISGLGDAGTLVQDLHIADATEPYATFTERANGETVTINRSTLPSRQLTIIDRPQMLYSTDDYHEVPDDADLDFAEGDALSTMVAFRTNSVAAGDVVLLSKKDDLTTAAGYALVRSTANGQGIIADGTLDDDDTVATISVRTLHTLAMVRNTTDNDIEVFLDGVGSGSATTDSTTATLANALVMRIGATSGATAANFFEGSIIGVAGWRDELTDTEVLEAHQALTALPAFPPFHHRQNRLIRM